ncbi:nucleoside-diphosphate sugar epimerase/dehydratase [Bdellovibrio bacteriovorus]|uniref:nucleoside-diphosphate sugar epimerase/dehydratase n=1 Tax=Bdellovibrio bacteriovorus TaxID=959 RepID=UPI0035A5FD00
MDDRIIATVFYGVSLSVLLLTAAVVMGNVTGVPRSSIVIYWIIAIAYITSSRFIARGVLRSLEREQDRRQPVAIYGAGRSGLQTALALMSGPEFRPVAFFDDNRQLHGTSVAGIRVYSPDEALNIMGAEDCNQLLIAMPSASRSRRRGNNPALRKCRHSLENSSRHWRTRRWQGPYRRHPRGGR